MTNQILPFDFDGHCVRAFTDETGKAWFVARDVAMLLEYTNPQKAINDHCKYVKLFKGNDSLPLNIPPRGYLVIPESDVWRLILRSKMPKAQKVEAWVMEEVLPTLLKTGSYSMRSLQGTPSGPRLSLDDVPEDVRRLKPRIRENCLSLAMQACRLTGVSEAEAIHVLFIDYCRAVGGLPAIEAGEPSLNSIIREYAKTQLEYRSGNRLQVTFVYKHFCRWWKQSQCAPTPSQRVFGRIMSSLYEVRKSNQMYYMNVAVIDSHLL